MSFNDRTLGKIRRGLRYAAFRPSRIKLSIRPPKKGASRLVRNMGFVLGIGDFAKIGASFPYFSVHFSPILNSLKNVAPHTLKRRNRH